jgi:uncharacterized protein
MSESRPRTLREIYEAGLSRREALRLGVGVGLGAWAMAWTRPLLGAPAPGAPLGAGIGHGQGDHIAVPPGYAWSRVLSWGDPILPEAGGPFDPAHVAALDARGAERRFGYNNDFLAFLPLPRGSDSSDHGLLVVNHEYTNPELMYPGYPGRWGQAPSARHVDVELASHGLSVVEVERLESGAWRVVGEGGRFNRRITGSTLMELRGPAAGHPRLRTSADPEGRWCLGTFNNCGGGVTPWGTVLTCEENVNFYFNGDRGRLEDQGLAALHARYSYGGGGRGWGRFVSRFDLEQEPHEPCRFNWVVEVDPYDPHATPIKRTALGRMKHEAATTTLTKDGRVAVYMGDDSRFEYLYKFVTRDRLLPEDAEAQRDLLDHGVLHVACCGEDGAGRWVRLVAGEGPLTPENGFNDQADVSIKTRLAADLVGATPMDRPEDVEVDPTTGRVYAALTNNSSRSAERTDAVNARARNQHGQLLEVIEDDEDAASETFRWDLLLLGGDPAQADHGARYGEGSPSFLSCPDNLAFGGDGRLFVATDGQPRRLDVNDGLYLVGTRGAQRGQVRQLLSAVTGAEVTGPCPTHDGRTVFVSIQHPGEGGSLDEPSSRFPDYREDLPPRPSVIALYREDGGIVGD